jgi:caffeoyl-CoA O-methyltransferase
MIDTQIDNYCVTHTSSESELLLELLKKTEIEMDFTNKISGRLIGRTLRLLTQLHQPKRVLEIGMFTGYSALTMAEVMPEGGEIHCLESSPKAIAFSGPYIENSPYKDVIHTHFGKALNTLIEIPAPFDMAFIDADKRNYPNYYEMVVPRMNKGGLILVDNALWSGKVIDPQSDGDLGVDRLNKRIHEDPRVENVLLTISDGLNIVRVL